MIWGHSHTNIFQFNPWIVLTFPPSYRKGLNVKNVKILFQDIDLFSVQKRIEFSDLKIYSKFK